MYQVLIAASKTLQHRLETAIRADPILFATTAPYRVRNMEVRLNTPREMKDGTHEGVSLWLYRIVRDDMRLNDPPVRPTPLTLQPPPLPLRAHYLVTPITSRAHDGDPETEQYLMGKILQTLHSQPVLRGVDLQAELAGTTTELRSRLETLTLDEMSRVWDALDDYQLSVSYEMSLLTIDSPAEPERIAPVTTVLPEVSLIV